VCFLTILKKLFALCLIVFFQYNFLPVFADDTVPSAINIPKGEELRAVIQTSIDSDKISHNEQISAVIQEDWYYKNILIAPRGSILNGNIVKIRRSGDYLRNGNISFRFYEIVTPQGIISVKTNIVKITKGKMRGLKVFVKFLSGFILGGLASVIETNFIFLPVVAAAGLVVGFANASDRGSEAILPAGTSIILRTKTKIKYFIPQY
jgi:hypothetical protein